MNKSRAFSILAAALAWCLTAGLPAPTLAAPFEEVPTSLSLGTNVSIFGTVDGGVWTCPLGYEFISSGSVVAPVSFSLAGPLASETISSDAFSILNPTLLQADALCSVPGNMPGQTTVHFEITDYSLSLPAFSGTFGLFATSLQTSLTYTESFAYRVLVGGTLLGSGTITRDVTTPGFTISVLHQDVPPPGFSISTAISTSEVPFNLLTGPFAGHSVDLTLSVLVTADVVFEAAESTTTTTTSPHREYDDHHEHIGGSNVVQCPGGFDVNHHNIH